MLSQLGSRQMIGNSENSYGDDFEKEMGLLLREHRRRDADDLEKEQNMYRSGSAPPTVEGSLSAVGGMLNHGVGGGSYIGGSADSVFARNSNGNGLLSTEDLRSDPAYLSYYYSNVNLNPRLPHPLLSREDWRSTQGFRGGSSAIGDRRKVKRFDGRTGGRSQFPMPPGFNSESHEIDNEDKLHGSVEWGGDGLIGLPGLGPASNQKSLTEIFQEDLNLSAPVSRHPSRPTSRNAFDDSNAMFLADAELVHFRRDLSSLDAVHTTSNSQNSSSTPYGGPASYSYAAAAIASLSRSSTPDPQLIARAPNPNPNPNPNPIGGGRVGNREKRSISSPNAFSGVSSLSNDSVDLVGSLPGLNLSDGKVSEEKSSGIEKDTADDNSYLFNLHGDQNNMRQQIYMKKSEPEKWNMPSAPQAGKRTYDYGSKNDGSSDLSNNLYLFEPSNVAANGGVGMPSHFQLMDSPNSSFSNYGISGYSMSPISGQVGSSSLPEFGNAAAAMDAPGMSSRMFEGSNLGSAVNHSLRKMGNQMTGSALQGAYVDPLYLQYLRSGEYTAAQVAALNDSSADWSYMGNSYVDLLQKAYIGNLLSTQKSHYSVPLAGKTGVSSPHGYYANPAFSIGLTYPGSPLASPLIPNSVGGPGSPIRHGDFNFRIPGGVRNLSTSVTGPWHMDNIDNSFGSSLLEEFKSNKTKPFELSEIAGHVVEFSADQYGSRFIQQKLETASTDEKNMVFEEIFPQALTLMTDVFGNYVIQKFFEHGMDEQRRQLASELFGHVLTLSLQMYGCRVIQKAIEAVDVDQKIKMAIEVVDVDQKIKMVKELDGHVMRCVRDQNGNHVIQKCIECAHEEHIQFIVSTFFGQVVTLSTHPYGCRVIQRVLEHCNDAKTQSKVMEEILGSVSLLAQDQYGNYVIQHVLEHGKPQERSTIIQELAGKIVQMSQQKFASNVVEKCLAFGDPSERQLLVSEMLGTTDENEPLQAMMKDQFANYVVQKVLETCSDQQRDLILSRIKVHLNALKKYTYGKHIVARVEKLVATGERRMAAQSLNSV